MEFQLYLEELGISSSPCTTQGKVQGGHPCSTQGVGLITTILHLIIYYITLRAPLVAQMVKNLPAMAGDPGSIIQFRAFYLAKRYL